jgi:hypothetical protein
MYSVHPKVQGYRRGKFIFRNRTTVFLTADIYIVYGLFNKDIRS